MVKDKEVKYVLMDMNEGERMNLSGEKMGVVKWIRDGVITIRTNNKNKSHPLAEIYSLKVLKFQRLTEEQREEKLLFEIYDQINYYFSDRNYHKD